MQYKENFQIQKEYGKDECNILTNHEGHSQHSYLEFRVLKVEGNISYIVCTFGTTFMTMFGVVFLITIIAFNTTILMIYIVIYMMILWVALHMLHKSKSQMIISIVIVEDIMIGIIFTIIVRDAFLLSYGGIVVIF